MWNIQRGLGFSEMNVVREIQNLNQRELELGISGSASWHHEYRHSAYIFVGNLDYRVSEADIIVVFSQFGEVVDLRVCRDKKTGKPLGFAFLAYEDQRSTVLAVDNMNGAAFLGRTLRVDHAARYTTPASRQHVEGEVDEERYDSDSDYEERRRLIWDYEAYYSDSEDLDDDEDTLGLPSEVEDASINTDAFAAIETASIAPTTIDRAEVRHQEPDGDDVVRKLASQSLLKPSPHDPHAKDILLALEARRRERQQQRLQQESGSDMQWRQKQRERASDARAMSPDRRRTGERDRRSEDRNRRREDRDTRRYENGGRDRDGGRERDRDRDRYDDRDRDRNRDRDRESHRDRDRDRDRERRRESHRDRDRSRH